MMMCISDVLASGMLLMLLYVRKGKTDGSGAGQNRL